VWVLRGGGKEVKRWPHVIATMSLAGTVAVISRFEPDGWVVAGGVLAGVVLNPDQDQGKTPYGWVRKHRGLSHWPVIGTLDRLVWSSGPALAAWLLSGRTVDWAGLALLAAGLVLADLLHVMMDEGEKRWKRWVS